MNQATILINSLINKNQTVEEVANVFVLNYAPFVYELSKIIDQQFHDDKNDKKSLCINLVCEILRKSFENNSSHHLFVKGLAQRLRYFLHSMSRNYVNEGIALQINRNIDSFKYKGLFCDQYFQKLQTLARKIKENSNPENGKLLEKSYSFEEASKNYSRTFLSMIRDINKCESLKPILDTYYEYAQVDKDNLKRLNESRVESIDPQSSMRESEDGKGSSSNLQIKDLKKQKLEKVIKQCHKHILLLQKSMGQEVKKYEEGLNSTNLRIDSQYEISE